MHHLRARQQHAPAPTTDPSGPGARTRLRWTETGPRLVLSGEVDLSSAPHLDALRALLDRHGHRACVEAAEVAFIDVAGLDAVLRFAGPGGSLLVLHPSPALLRLLDLLALTGAGPSVVRAGPREEALVLRAAPRPAGR